MIDLVLKIPEFDWTVRFHAAVTCYHSKDIYKELRTIGCPATELRRAYLLINDCSPDKGLTYSNGEKRTSVVVVGKTSSAAEFLNSLEHEIRHLVDDIVIISGYYDKEDIAYLTGEINRELYPFVKRLLCDECRRKAES